VGDPSPNLPAKRNPRKTEKESARFYISESAGLIQMILEDGDKFQVVQGKEKIFANI
jgi:hypothetical protein